jgi:hypothetical protein
MEQGEGARGLHAGAPACCVLRFATAGKQPRAGPAGREAGRRCRDCRCARRRRGTAETRRIYMAGEERERMGASSPRRRARRRPQRGAVVRLAAQRAHGVDGALGGGSARRGSGGGSAKSQRRGREKLGEVREQGGFGAVVGERNAQNRFGEEKQCSLAPDARASGCVRATHAGACGLGCQARRLGASWPLGRAQAGGGGRVGCLPAACARARGGLAADAGAGSRRRERAGPRRARGWAGGAASWAATRWAERGGKGREGRGGWASRAGPGRELG